MSEATQHSPIGASSMYRWAACAGSVRESKGKESTQSVYAADGIQGHDLSAKLLTGEVVSLLDFDDEMVDAVDFYVNYIRSRKIKGSALLVEHSFDLSDIHPGCYGTADAVIWTPSIKHLIVIDFKYGAGILVDPKDNLQLMYYALGALTTCGFPAETVEMVIVQPRCDHPDGVIRSHTIDAIDLFDFSVDLKEYAEATERPDAPLVPGEHCRFCPAAPSCTALNSQTQSLAKLEFRADLSYDPAKLKIALDGRDAVKAWLKTVDEFAYLEAERGRCAPGYKLVEKRPTRKWKDETEAETSLFDMSDTPEQMEDMYVIRKLKTPAQMEKVFSKKEISELVEKVSSGHTLVPESDPRPAVRPSAKQVFLEAGTEK